MPVTFKILPRRNLALFTYSGMVGLQESMEVVAAATNHPDYRPTMRQLCDLSRVTGVERDYLALLRMQAKIVESLYTPESELVVLFYAPQRAGREMAQMARKSWEGLNSVLVLILDREAQALAVLGLPEMSLQALADLHA
ncbi:MAG: hypothetical protein Q7T28_08930 [Cypionkella sp.]|uniref:hypothetical protein n=1 Tax=Cypionkella sp. TaxID=2811411 RepID=UPI0027244B3A|nr:hypothetical protein [Cypionkella sp.]MDO8327047.1 hypothetical protein [Cypionkella sp.]